MCAAFILELDPTIDEVDEIKTAISEAVTNSIIHGYENDTGTVCIEGDITGREVTYIVRDAGCGIDDIQKAMEPLYTGKPGAERSGMGFSIMEAFMDELRVESCPGNATTIIMKKRIREDAG